MLFYEQHNNKYYYTTCQIIWHSKNAPKNEKYNQKKINKKTMKSVTIKKQTKKVKIDERRGGRKWEKGGKKLDLLHSL